MTSRRIPTPPPDRVNANLKARRALSTRMDGTETKLQIYEHDAHLLLLNRSD